MTSKVTIQPFDEVLDVEDGESVLAAALRQGKYLKYGCKHGGCGTCRAVHVSGDHRLGEQTSYSLTDADREAGILLLCSTHDVDDLVVDVSQTMQLRAEEFHAGLDVNEHLAQVESITRLTHDIRSLRLRLVDPPEMSFVAGQYVEVEVPGGSDEWRAYSMANPPSQREHIDLIVKCLPGGRFSSALDGRLAPDDLLRVRGPHGQFRAFLSHRPMIMVAGGSGMAPIRSILLDLAETGNQRTVTFFYGARTDDDLFAVDELRSLEQTHGWFTFVPALSEPERNTGPWDGETGLITEVMTRRLPTTRGAEGYLCGPPPMIDAAIQVLAASGCKERHIFFDRFVPSG